ncbi:Replication initiator protein A [Stieleria neptunia]|uniref:Replication initiator protein A n=1 Tax=Stieleria neptunia TaxID=2527979 RepID=A0A518HNV1_9BACT|nr:replication initiator protein A [Stieleria neptunia]QDV42524.1 Replication initiator protein A [Stieleria neptunia]
MCKNTNLCLGWEITQKTGKGGRKHKVLDFVAEAFDYRKMTNVCQTTRAPLLPDRYPVGDLFICDVTDAIPKDDLHSMEHPIFSLSTKPDTRVREYEHNGVRITVTPSSLGLASIHDKDILIYCISQLIAKINDGHEPKRTLHLTAHDLLVTTNRTTDGRGYEQLVAALDRLSGTRIKTNLKSGGEEITEGFGLIDSWRIVRHTKSGRMSEMRINLSDWIFNAVNAREVLTLSREYFRLRRPLERRMYELARKHCGRQAEWTVSLELLRKKCGSGSTMKEFRRLVRRVVEDDCENDHMPDYRVRLEERGDGKSELVVFQSRGTIPAIGISGKKVVIPELDPDIYHDARLVCPGWDVRELEKQWREWIEASGAEPPRNADAAFVGFCRRWASRR